MTSMYPETKNEGVPNATAGRTSLCTGPRSSTRFSLFVLACILPVAVVAQPETITLWPAGAPQPPGFEAAPEMEVTRKVDDGVRRITNVAEPTMTLYKPGTMNGAAVLVCPGGGYNILSIVNEGTLVCEWLNSLGVTSVLLKYRVPTRRRPEPVREPLQDAQRALGMLRHRADAWGIDPDRIGILGFSAGGHIAVMAALHPNERTYTRDPALEAADATPNFVIPVYPAFLVDPGNTVLRPEYRVTTHSPPICLIHAHDDNGLTSSSGSALLYLEYKKHKRPAELHIYTKGGHGFGMKKAGLPADGWPARAGEWMQSMGWLAGPDKTGRR
jgi:dienelactone hydrolase